MEWLSLVKVEYSGPGENKENAQKRAYNLSEVIKLYNTENTDGCVENTSKITILIDKDVADHAQNHSIGDSLHGLEGIIPDGGIKMFSVS